MYLLTGSSEEGGGGEKPAGQKATSSRQGPEEKGLAQVHDRLHASSRRQHYGRCQLCKFIYRTPNRSLRFTKFLFEQNYSQQSINWSQFQVSNF